MRLPVAAALGALLFALPAAADAPPATRRLAPTSAEAALAFLPLEPAPARPRRARAATGSPNPVVQAGKAALWVWHNVLSPLDGPKCPMHPTCSAYCGLAMARYGPLQGIVMTGARMLKETPDTLRSGEYPLVKLGGTWRLFDPPERDVF